MPKGSNRGLPWTDEEDRILLRHNAARDFMAALAAGGYQRTEVAARSRKKMLLQKQKTPTSPDELARERMELEAEVETLARRLSDIRQRLIDIRVDQLRDALGPNVPVPEDLLLRIRDELGPP